MIKEVLLKVEGINISGQLYLPVGKAPFPTVCVCHGIPSGEPRKDGEGYPQLAERICGQGFAVFIFNFRGAGKSGGNFDLAEWTRDLKAVIDYLWGLGEVDKAHLGLLGFSGGAAVSVCVAAQDTRISCLACCACPAEFSFVDTVENAEDVVAHFRSIGTIRDREFPPSPQEWLDGFRQVRPIAYIAQLSPRPVLFVHGDQDETVPVSDARRLYDAAGEPKNLVIIRDAGHRLRQEERAVCAVLDWLKSVYSVDRTSRKAI